MSVSYYDIYIPQVTASLESLTHILKKAEGHANSASFTTARLSPDMLPLTMQVFFVTTFAQQIVHRMSGTDPLDLSKEMNTFDDYYARIKQVTDIVATANKQTIDARGDSDVTIGMGPGRSATMPLSAYLRGYAMPNMYFHVTTAYAILRKEGVELGKLDYLVPYLGEHAPKN